MKESGLQGLLLAEVSYILFLDCPVLLFSAFFSRQLLVESLVNLKEFAPVSLYALLEVWSDLV